MILFVLVTYDSIIIEGKATFTWLCFKKGIFLNKIPSCIKIMKQIYQRSYWWKKHNANKKEKERQRDRETKRQKGRKTERQINRKTEEQKDSKAVFEYSIQEFVKTSIFF